jgi:4-hydroxy-2-oxoglutarate aldolase
MDKLAQALSLCDDGVKPNFLMLDGVMHDLPAWKELGGHGTVSGISNIAPSSTVRLWNLCCLENRSVEQDEELREVLNVLSKVDAVVMPLGVRGLSKCPIRLNELVLILSQSTYLGICTDTADVLEDLY